MQAKALRRPDPQRRRGASSSAVTCMMAPLSQTGNSMLQRKPWLTASAILMATYIGYILWAKYAKVIGSPPIKLSETGEFLLFLAAIVAFTFQVFAEAKVDDAPNDKDHA